MVMQTDPAQAHVKAHDAGPQNVQKAATLRILLLGGPVGPFFTFLAKALKMLGHEVDRCIFNLGDRLFGLGGARAVSPEEVQRLIPSSPWDVVVAFGADRPRHAVFFDLFRRWQVPFLCLEEGYVRPGFVCAEWNGSHARSLLRRYPQSIADHEFEAVPDAGPYSGVIQGLTAIVQLVTIKIGECFGLGRWHRNRSLFAEAFRWPYSLFERLSHRSRDRAVLDGLIADDVRYRVFALQVHDDTNLLRNGDGLGQGDRIDEIIAAFVAHASPDEHFLFKVHPLDAGHFNYRKTIARAAERWGALDRVHCVCDVALGSAVKASIGLVTVNSTSGLSSLYHGVQTDVLGRAFYEGTGLARHCVDPAIVWSEPHGVDVEAYQELMRLVHTYALVPGSFSGLGGVPARLAARIAHRICEGPPQVADFFEPHAYE